MNGRIRATTPTRSDGAKSRIGFCTEFAGSAAACAASWAKASACSPATVTPSRRASSKTIV